MARILAYIALVEPATDALQLFINRAKEPAATAQLVVERWQIGQAAWPDLALAAYAWRTQLARHLDSSSDPDAHLAQLHAADFYLAAALTAKLPAALHAFEQLHMARVREFVVKVTVDSHTIEDIAQQLRERILIGGPGAAPKIFDYSGKGALGGWLRIAAVRIALNIKRRKVGIELTDSHSTNTPTLAHDPELAYLYAHSAAAFQTAFRVVIDNLSVERRTLLRLHYMQGLTLDQISGVLGVSRSTLGRQLQEARAEILAQTGAKLEAEHGLSRAAVLSLVRKAGSQLHVTFTKLLT